MISVRQTSRDAARLWRLCLVDGLPEPDRVREVVEQVIASGRHHRLEVLAAFMRLLKRDRDRRTAEVGSAAPLDEATRTVVQQGLARRFRRAMATTFVVDPSLIAGIRLRAAGELFDDTVSARLAALEIA